MSNTENEEIAPKFLAGMRQGTEPHALAAQILGDGGALPWLGRKTMGRAAIADFASGESMVEPCPAAGTKISLACVDAVGGDLYFVDTAK